MDAEDLEHGTKVRVFSISEPHAEPIMRGRREKPVEFGHKTLLVQTSEKLITDYEVHEKQVADSHLAKTVIARYETLFGTTPEVLAADKGFCPDAERNTLKNMASATETTVASKARSSGPNPPDSESRGLAFSCAQREEGSTMSQYKKLQSVFVGMVPESWKPRRAWDVPPAIESGTLEARHLSATEANHDCRVHNAAQLRTGLPGRR